MLAKMESSVLESKSISTKPKPKKTAKIKTISSPKSMATKRALKQPKSSVVVAAKEEKRTFPWFGSKKKKKMEEGTEDQEMDDFDALEIGACSQSQRWSWSAEFSQPSTKNEISGVAFGLKESLRKSLKR